MEGSGRTRSLRKTRNYSDGSMPPLRRFRFASPGYFGTLGIPLIAGRDFTWDETFQKLPVAIVSENFARASIKGGPTNAMGKHTAQGRHEG